MIDTSTAAPASPAPAAPPPPPGGAPAAGQPAPTAPPKPHHSQQQPREVGKFAGPPAKTEPAPAPRSFRVGEREIPEEEARLLLAERLEDTRAWREERAELERLRQEAMRWKDPAKVLTAEQREAIAKEQLRAFLEREEEAKLPPEERAYRQQRREFEAERKRFEAERQAEKEKAEAAEEQALRQEAVGNMRAVLKALGAPERPGILMRAVCDELAANARSGRAYSPEVVAHRVRQRLQAEATGVLAHSPEALLSQESVVAALNGASLEKHGALLAKLGPFMELARAYNLQQRGIAPGGAPPPPGQGQEAPPALAPGQQPRTTQQWISFFKSGQQATTPEEVRQRNYLLDRGLL